MCVWGGGGGGGGGGGLLFLHSLEQIDICMKNMYRHKNTMPDPPSQVLV